MNGGHHAVVIVGGGTAGCATAIALAARGVKDVTVVDMLPEPAWRIGEAIPPAARPVLERLGLWDEFTAQGHLPSAGSCASWGKAELGYNDFVLAGQGKGWHLDRAAFDTMLAAKVCAGGGRIMRGLRLREAERGGDKNYVLTFEECDGARSQIVANFLVDATGIAAGAARRLRVVRNQIDCIAVVSAIFNLNAPATVPSQALLEACEYGWWYAARIPGARMIAALAVEPSRHRDYSGHADFLAALRATRHVAQWFERGKAALGENLKPETALAPSAILSNVAGPRWLAVGDAASAYDPISAQGILKALCDSEAAAEAISAFLATDDKTPLLAYQDAVFARFRDYLRLRRHFYELESRWPRAPFWQSRLRLA